MHSLKCYELAVQFYRTTHGLRMPGHLKSQFLRACSSVALNLSEGSAKPSPKERAKFYRIALGSLRECQAIFDLVGLNNRSIHEQQDKLARHLYKLCKALE